MRRVIIFGQPHIPIFVVPATNRVKIKENENKNIYLDLASELKKLWNMKMKLIVIGILATVSRKWVNRR